jgi:hypothetical protein
MSKPRVITVELPHVYVCNTCMWFVVGGKRRMSGSMVVETVFDSTQWARGLVWFGLVG